MRKLKITAVLIASTLSACSSGGEKVTYPVEPKEVRSQLPQILDQKGIWFKKVNDREFTFYKRDLPRVFKIGDEISSTFIPRGRSISYETEYCEIFMRRAKEAGVPFKVVRFGDRDWIVWEENVSGDISVIEKAASKEFEDALSNRSPPPTAFGGS